MSNQNLNLMLAEIANSITPEMLEACSDSIKTVDSQSDVAYWRMFAHKNDESE